MRKLAVVRERDFVRIVPAKSAPRLRLDLPSTIDHRLQTLADAHGLSKGDVVKAALQAFEQHGDATMKVRDQPISHALDRGTAQIMKFRAR